LACFFALVCGTECECVGRREDCCIGLCAAFGDAACVCPARFDTFDVVCTGPTALARLVAWTVTGEGIAVTSFAIGFWGCRVIEDGCTRFGFAVERLVCFVRVGKAFGDTVRVIGACCDAVCGLFTVVGT
jgi:hypothetical protein